MMMGFANLHERIPTSPIDSVAIVVLDCVVVVEVERVVDSTSRRPWAIPVDFAVVVVVVVVVVVLHRRRCHRRRHRCELVRRGHDVIIVITIGVNIIARDAS